MSRSRWEELSEWNKEELEQFLDQIGEMGRLALLHEWSIHARPEQLPSAGDDWRIWLVMAGRGFGKTRAGAEWVRGIAQQDGDARIALVAASLHEARSIMVEGESGLLGIAPGWDRPEWFPALRKLIWKSGAQALLYGAADPETLRGPQFTHGWADEVAKWPLGQAAWDNFMMGLRLGAAPRVVVTTTPRPVPLLRQLVKHPLTITTRGATQDNRANLPASFIAAMEADYAGTSLGRQELNGELIEEMDGALWTRGLIERCRVARSEMSDAGNAIERLVVAVDPPAGTDGDACGIVVVAKARDGRALVLADASVVHVSPEAWARAVAGAASTWGADKVVAEANNGGAMVESVLHAAQADLPVKLVHASRGKSARAEPVAVLYEAGRVRHVGAFPDLEDQMCGLMLGGGYAGPGRSPDRADALVWGLTELMLGKAARQAIHIL
ncbi:MAG: terminase family protein [Sphingobium sp.]